MKLWKYGLGEYGFCILSVRMQVQTVERALTSGSIKLSVVRFNCFGGFFVGLLLCFFLFQLALD